MSPNALVRDDELHTRTDAERASERVLRPSGVPSRVTGVGRTHLRERHRQTR